MKENNEATRVASAEEAGIELDPKQFKKALKRKVKAAGGTKSFLKSGDFLKNLTKLYFETMLDEEMSEHLGYEKYAAEGYNGGNSRNGTTTKKIRGDFGEVEIESPRDRDSEFNPQIIGKRESNVGNFADKIISLYARGMTTREIEEHLHEMYSIEVSAQFISRATARIQDDITDWQSRPLEKLYPVVYIDGLWVSVRAGDNKGAVVKKCVYVVLGLNLNGVPDVLGLWVAESEGAKFWLRIFEELKTRGVEDIFILCGDGLKGLNTAQEAAFPKTDLQLCIVHQIRNTLKYVPHKHKKQFCSDMRSIYTASTLEAAELAFREFKNTWGEKYPVSVGSWENNWNFLTTFFRYPVELRTMIYTTNSIESLNAQLRKNTSNRKIFPNDESVLRILFLNIKNFTKKWTKRKDWNIVIQKLSIMFEDRMPKHFLENN